MQFQIKKRFLNLFVFLLLAQLGQAQQKIIGTVEVEGNKSADKNLIVSISGLQTGTSIDYEAIQNAIHAIYGLRLFSDVQILGKEAGDKINLTIKVAEYPRIKEILIEGNNKIGKDDVKGALTVKEGELVDGEVED